MTKIVFLTATHLESKDNFIMDYPIIYTGVGKIQSTMTTVDVIKNIKPDLIINFGSCGALSPDLELGRLLSVGVVHNDIDCTPKYEYGETPFQDNLKDIRLTFSNVSCITTDRFYDSSRKDYSKNFKKLVKKSHIVDMELYAIAQVCRNYKVECLSYKWISDHGDISKWNDGAISGYELFKERMIKLYG